MGDLSTHRIGNGTLSAQITNFGASLTDLRLAGVHHGLVLGFPDMLDQISDRQFMGAVIGRYANRIARGHVPWDKAPLKLERNERGKVHLHGGTDGFASALWDVEEVSDTAITLRLESADGHAGYPGTLIAHAQYEVTEDATLRLTLSATADQDTIVNLCHHPYFNLDGRPGTQNHRLWIGANHYLPVNNALIPKGRVAPVHRTPFDFTQEAPLQDQPYNNTYCLHREQTGPLTHCATLRAGDISLDLSTTQPGLHLYDGHKIKPTGIGHGGAAYRPNAGICLEAQAWPDSPNNINFPPVRLAAGAQYTQVTEYKFSGGRP